MARICNDERVRLGVVSGHDRKTLTLADGSRSSISALGLSTQSADGQVFSELRSGSNASGRDITAATGVRHQWTLAQGLRVTTSAERQQARAANHSEQQATALALGAEYSANPLYRIGGKLEWRDTTLQDSLLVSLGLDRKLDRDWTALLRAMHLSQLGRGSGACNDQTQGRLQLGLAYRDTQTNAWHAVGRFEHRSDEQRRNLGGLLSGQDTRSTIASLHTNHQPTQQWTHMGQLAWKTVHERQSSGPAPGAATAPATTAAHWRGGLIGWRSLRDIGERWDAGVYASVQRAQGTHLSGLGAELGYRVVDNLWLSAGWTAGRYSDIEMFSSNASWRGVHLRLRFKFDERLFDKRP